MTLPHRLDFYNSPEGAAEYLEEYEKSHRKISDKRERKLLSGYFQRVGEIHRTLDLPCGWGRYLPYLQSQSELVYQSDWSHDMLALGQERFGSDSSAGRFRSLGNQLPLASQSMELCFSMRLNHHLVDPAVRRKHVEEMFRVSNQWVIFSYFDNNSLKSWTRRVRKFFGGKKGLKNTLLRSEVREIAAQAGFEVVADPMLFAIGSGHRIVLAKRQS
ncbi:MAG: hypothetical protein CMJ96_04515 [Planctomycetes bacterium]|jgi:ubiquinone/menaquinone biosynthesis C-methylase UbiE|nr:hypothetical protein [Planctomycetota bacterium]MDP7246218.1 methyltransferase domain-containing protein [Planctomycetota bacterium]|tara:strand:- start:862 stop:1509 length:648 start_codon:yes stop_codon:yes gene_type:complete